MSSALCITVRFLDPVPQFHGRGDDGTPEWPPSPLRLFQALVSAAATRWSESQFHDYARPALKWLEVLPASIVAPRVPLETFGYRMYVPNNSGDLMTAAWARGDTETNMAKFRVEKDVRPVHLTADAVHYLYPLPDGCPHFEVLAAAARSITHLGWGIDMAAGNASILTDAEAEALPGERWRPTDDGSGTPLRVPIDGTLADLSRKHADFLNRLSPDGFKPVPPLSAFRVVAYRRTTDPAPRLFFVPFRIVSADPDGKNPSFDTARRARDVASWLRNAAGRVYDGPAAATFVHGHDPADDARPAKGNEADKRLHFLPVPTINRALNRVEAIRRVLLAGPVGMAERVRQLARRLEGEELLWDGRPNGLLAPIRTDLVVEQYTKSARTWATVTPVILPGYDDRDDRKTGPLLRRAFAHAGLPEDVVDGGEDLAWRNVGFRAGVDLASRYARPDKLIGRAVHVRITFPRAIPGPLAVGAGRYRGFGLFAAE